MPNNRPNIKTIFYLYLSDRLPTNRLRTAFIIPKLAIKDNITVLDSYQILLFPIEELLSVPHNIQKRFHAI